MTRLHPRRIVLALHVALSLSIATTARAQHSDVLLANVAGQVAIGAAEDVDGPAESFDLETLVFENILRTGFAPPTPADYEADEPGFFALNAVGDADVLTTLGADALPGGASVGISLSPFTIGSQTSAVFYWDGVGEVDFQPAPAGTNYAFSPAANFATTGLNGDIDDHPIYQIDNGGAGAAADGVYLVSPVIDVEGLASSGAAPWAWPGERGSFFVVTLVDALITGEEELELVEEALEALEEGAPDALAAFPGGETKDFAFYEEAVEFVEANAVPEPAGAAISAIAIGCLLASGRRLRARGAA